MTVEACILPTEKTLPRTEGFSGWRKGSRLPPSIVLLSSRPDTFGRGRWLRSLADWIDGTWLLRVGRSQLHRTTD